MVRESLRSIPDGQVDVTLPVTIDGLSYIDPDDPAMPMYRVIANNRQPVALRDLMIAPVRSGYIGDGHQPDPALVPRTGAEAVPDVSVDQVYLPVRDGVARCQLYRPSATPDGTLPVIVYFHGGGFTVGSSEDCGFLARKLSLTNHALVVSANYRSAPEFAFPVPLDDAFDVYRWVAVHADEIGGDGSCLAIAGDSAGSNLAAALPLRAREEGVRIPDAVVMLGAYVGPTPWNHPLVSPIEADLSGYPPTVVVAGTHDPIVDSAKAFAQRIREAGGTTVDYFPAGMPHGFYFFPGVHPEEAVAYDIVAGALATAFGR